MNIALTMDYGVVTNDIYSPIEEVFDNVLKVSPSEEFPDFPTDAEVIFDLGGYIEARSITVLRNSKVVLVPTINEYSILSVIHECCMQGGNSRKPSAKEWVIRNSPYKKASRYCPPNMSLSNLQRPMKVYESRSDPTELCHPC